MTKSEKHRENLKAIMQKFELNVLKTYEDKRVSIGTNTI